MSYPSYNIRYNEWPTFCDVYGSQNTPSVDKIEETRLFRMYPVASKQDTIDEFYSSPIGSYRCIDYEHGFGNFELDTTYDSAHKKAFEILAHILKKRKSADE